MGHDVAYSRSDTNAHVHVHTVGMRLYYHWTHRCSQNSSPEGTRDSSTYSRDEVITVGPVLIAYQNNSTIPQCSRLCPIVLMMIAIMLSRLNVLGTAFPRHWRLPTGLL